MDLCGSSEASMGHGNYAWRTAFRPTRGLAGVVKIGRRYCHPLAESSVMRFVLWPELVSSPFLNFITNVTPPGLLSRTNGPCFLHEVVQHTTCSEFMF